MSPRFKHVGDIQITNRLRVVEDASPQDVAMKLIESSFQGLPVFNKTGDLVGKVTEIDLLKALKAGKNLRTITVRDIMSEVPPALKSESSLEEAVEVMDAHHLIRLPVLRAGRFIGSITRHDLLRAWLGVWTDHERGSYSEVLG